MTMVDIVSLNDIGYRAWVECMRVFGSVKTAASSLLCCENTIYKWHKSDITPNARTLADMLDAGCDVIYILTGRRSNPCKKVNR